MTSDSLNITTQLAQELIQEQFPKFARLTLQPVARQGHDNRTFRLGEEMSIRLPTAESYALKVPKEQELLPFLAPHLSLSIPSPLFMGKPSKYYPWPWSIYQWLPGKSANEFTAVEDNLLESIAYDLAQFLRELHRIDPSHGPTPGLHNWWRGDHIRVYDAEARTYIAALSKVINSDQALDLWENAMATQWKKEPVWIHGDMAYGNILLQEGKLTGVIDFGGMGIGDPACDLVMAWTFFKGKSREIFKQSLSLDNNTWLRAKAWALWKAAFELCQLDDTETQKAFLHKKIISDVLTA